MNVMVIIASNNVSDKSRNDIIDVVGFLERKATKVKLFFEENNKKS